MNRSRITGDLVSQNNIFVDIANDRVGIGSTIPAQKLSLPDNARIALGDSADFQIYHSTHLNNSHITKNESGIFFIDTLGDIQIRKNNGETKAKFISDGAVELYHDGSKKFETTAYGIDVTGTTGTDGLVVSGVTTATGNINATGSLSITSAAPELFLTDTNANSDYSIVVNGGQFRIRDETNSANRLAVNSDGHVDIYGRLDAVGGFLASANSTIEGDLTLTDTTADSAAGPEFKLFRNSASPADADYLGQIKFAGESDTGVERNYAKITGKILDASNGTEDGIIEFAHIKAGSQTITGRWRSDSLQLLNGTALTVAGSTTVTGNIIPSSDSATDIGTNSVRFANLYADTLYGDGSNLTGLTAGVISDSDNNTLGGTNAGNNFNTSGDMPTGNTLFGKNAGDELTNHDYSTAIGYDALKSGSYNTAVGYQALMNNTGNTGNTAIGVQALRSCTTGSAMVAVGYGALYSTTSGAEMNVAVGNGAMQNLTTGDFSVALGNSANYNSTTASNNTAIGYQTLFVSNSGNNTALGYHAGRSVTGTDNTLIGTQAGMSGSNDLTSGSNNTLIGHDAAASSATVSNEVTIGDASVTKFRIPGINFILKDNGGTPTVGQVLKADNNGEGYWGAAVHDPSTNLTLSGNRQLNFSSSSLTASTTDDSFTINHQNTGAFKLTKYGAGWEINSSLVPTSDSALDIGTNTVRVRNGYFDTLYGDGSNLTGITGTTINNNADNYVITGSGTANTLEAESTLTFSNRRLTAGGLTLNDDGVSGNLLNVYPDDQNIWAFAIGNSTYHATSGLYGYMANAGDFLLRYTGNSEYKSLTLEQHNGSSNRTWASFGNGGNVKLYYQGTSKFETTSVGATVTGQLHVNSGYINLDDNYSYAMGTNNRAQLYHSGSHQYLLNTVGNMYFMPKSGEYSICCYPDAQVELYHDNAVKLATTSTGVSVTGNVITSGNFDSNIDGGRVSVGDSADLYMTHTNNGLIDCNTGNLDIVTQNTLSLKNADSENAVVCNKHGSVDLYCDNGLKFQTKSDGVKLYQGHFYADDSSQIRLGSGQDLKLYHDGTDSHVNNYSGTFYIQAADALVLQNTSGEKYIRSLANAAVELYYNGNKKFETTSLGVDVNGTLVTGAGDALIVDQSNNLKFCVGEYTSASTSTGTVSMDARTYDTNKARLHKWTSPNAGGGSYGNYSEAWYDGGAYRYIYSTSAGFKFEHHVLPQSNNTYDLGTTSLRWRNVYTQDLQLSNEAQKDEGGNDVDGTWGDWTLQEGESDVYMINNRSGKKFRIKMEEVS